MRKEVLLAIIVGIILGAVILFGIRLANESSSPETPGQNGNVVPTPTTTASETLSIITPVNHSVTDEKTVTLTGKTDPGATLAVVSEEDDLIIEAGPEGTFSAQINLISGENIITVSQVLKDQKISSVSVSIIQTSNLPE